MRTIWHSLIWKEWHEHKWKLAALTTIVIGIIAAMCFGTSYIDFVELTAFIALSCLAPLTIYVAAFDATAERSRNTAPLLAALPIPSWKAGLAKLAFGLMACVIPILPALFIITWLRPPVVLDTLTFLWREKQLTIAPWTWCLVTTIYDASIVASIYLWTAATAARRRDEVSGSAVAIATIGSLWVAILFCARGLERYGLGASTMLAEVISSSLPGGLQFFAKNHWPLAELVPAAVYALAVHCALVVWFVRRFTACAKESNRPSLWAANNSNISWLGPPRHSRFSAIVWKQCREIGPPLAVGLTAITAIVTAIVLFDRADYSDAQRILELLAFVVVNIGFFVALTVGIGLLLNDLSPQLNAFWRSRPINPDLWFWTRFCFVPLTLLFVTAVPVTIAAWWNLSSINEIGNWIQRGIFMAIPTLLCLYALAVAMACLLRNAIYAAVLSIALLAAPFIVAWLIWLVVASLGLVAAPRSGAIESFSTPVTFAILIVTTLAATATSWLAVRNDWGRKS